MIKPFSSFIIAIFFYLGLVFFLINFVSKKSQLTLVSLEIEAYEINGYQHQEQSSATKKTIAQKVQHDLANNDNSQKTSSKNIEAIYNPLPLIPDDLRDEAFNSKTLAKFYINENGAVEKVELIKSSTNPRLNRLLIASLKKWKFSAIGKNSTKEIEVNFEVK